MAHRKSYRYPFCTAVSHEGVDYFAVVSEGGAAVFKGEVLLFHFTAEGLCSAVFDGRLLYFTKKEDDGIWTYNPKEGTTRKEAHVEGCGELRLWKCGCFSEGKSPSFLDRPKDSSDGQKNWLVVEIIKGTGAPGSFSAGSSAFYIYDIQSASLAARLPDGPLMDFGFKVSSDGSGEAVILEDKAEGDDFDYIMMEDGDSTEEPVVMTGVIEPEKSAFKRTDVLSIVNTYDDFYERFHSRPYGTNGMRLPIFDCYLYYWPEPISLSSSSRYIVYYIHDFRGVIISTRSGDVYRLFALPQKYLKISAEGEKYSEGLYVYFNDKTNILTIITEGKPQCCLITTDEKGVQALNAYYNDNYSKKRISLQNDQAFIDRLNRVLSGTVCEKI